MVIYTIKVVLLTIATIIITMAISDGEKSIIFVAKRIVTLASIQIICNKRQKNSGHEIENSMEIKINITYF